MVDPPLDKEEIDRILSILTAHFTSNVVKPKRYISIEDMDTACRLIRNFLQGKEGSVRGIPSWKWNEEKKCSEIFINFYPNRRTLIISMEDREWLTGKISKSKLEVDEQLKFPFIAEMSGPNWHTRWDK